MGFFYVTKINTVFSYESRLYETTNLDCTKLQNRVGVSYSWCFVQLVFPLKNSNQ